MKLVVIENLSVNEYLDKIKENLRDMIIDLQKYDTWKFQLTIAINLIYSKDVDEECLILSKYNNIEFMPHDNANEVVNDLFESLLSRYQIDLEKLIRKVILFSIQFTFHIKSLTKISFKCKGSYIHSPDWIKNKNPTTNSNNTDDKCFQYAVIVALNHEELKRDPQRISKNKPFINKYKWNGYKISVKNDDWKTFEKNNPTIALNVLYIKEKEVYPANISKHNSTREQVIILLVISNEEKVGWHYLAVKNYLHYYME